MITPDYHTRLTSFRQKMLEADVDAAFISKKENIFYLTGYPALHPTEREAYLIITKNQAILYHTPFISPSPPTRNLLLTLPMSAHESLAQIFSAYLADTAVLGIEKLNLTVTEAERCQSLLPQAALVSIDKVLISLREVKDAVEIRQINKARLIASKTLKWIHNFIRSAEAVGIKEKTLADRIDAQLKTLGADGPAFPTIVAFDAHSAFPHHIPVANKLRTDSIVLVDMGAEIDGYRSDMTRTWCLAPHPSAPFSHIEKIVLEAYRSAKAHLPLHTATTASTLDAAARDVINQAGFGDNFIHTTGHGVGLEPHEAPSINLTNQDFLKPGMVITIEPGIYLPGRFGYRHEDTFVVT